MAASAFEILADGGSAMKEVYEIAVVHGDGIGPEVCAATVEVVKAALGPGNPRRCT